VYLAARARHRESDIIGICKYAKALDQTVFLAFSDLHADEPEVDTKDLLLLELMIKHEAMVDKLARVRAVLREGSGKNSAVTSF